MVNPHRPALHSLIGDFKDAIRYIEMAWDSRDEKRVREHIQEAGRRADECMVRLRGLL